MPRRSTSCPFGAEATSSETRTSSTSIPLAAALFLLLVVGAEAHSRYVRSEPGQGAIIATELERVQIWFTQDLFRRQGENRILVIGPDGNEVQSGEALIAQPAVMCL